MKGVGYLFVALIALGFAGALLLMARSVPDIGRYVRMRRM